ncbi:hypothetical protein C1752_01956 [Acaryochloris thomasi RCC1774]|uniref:Uncharacterized protein n=1 Tax=Acaryochloris thomasi RCC1774 TaxID=1764569 RepID=A0A2W1JJR0_9CYAN|nr:hypothetical protein C1752_01956 [Acaryochloris thomasi RCC1774]
MSLFLPFCFATGMALDSLCIDMPFCFFVIPFLGCGFPDFSFATESAGERLVDVVLWQATVGVDVREFAGI